jgi:hypothetical protein
MQDQARSSKIKQDQARSSKIKQDQAIIISLCLVGSSVMNVDGYAY